MGTGSRGVGMGRSDGSDQGRRIEVHITDSDRLVEFQLGDDQDPATPAVADALVSALGANDPRDVESRLESGLGDLGTVRSGP
jgi:hypothetical protein